MQDAGQVLAAAALEVREQRRVPVAEALARVLARSCCCCWCWRRGQAGLTQVRPGAEGVPLARRAAASLPLRGDIVSKNSW